MAIIAAMIPRVRRVIGLDMLCNPTPLGNVVNDFLGPNGVGFDSPG